MQHVFHKCDKDDCFICNGGLSLCVVCGQGEVELQPECPGKAPRRMVVCLYCGKNHIIPGDEIGQQELITLMRQHDVVCEKSPFNVPMNCGHPARYLVEMGKKQECSLCKFQQLYELSLQAIEGASNDATEWNRFWEAMGVKSADITVDQAIEKYKALEARITELEKDMPKLLETLRQVQAQLKDDNPTLYDIQMARGLIASAIWYTDKPKVSVV
jgi:hypothetical protein